MSLVSFCVTFECGAWGRGIRRKGTFCPMGIDGLTAVVRTAISGPR